MQANTSSVKLLAWLFPFISKSLLLHLAIDKLLYLNKVELCDINQYETKAVFAGLKAENAVRVLKLMHFRHAYVICVKFLFICQ